MNSSVKISSFKNIQKMAEKRKGGKKALQSLLKPALSDKQLSAVSDDRFLSTMSRCIFHAGFNWSVVEKKWPGFEEVFFGFNPYKLAYMDPGDWHKFMTDKRIIRNGIKVRTVFDNANFIVNEAEKHGSFAKFITSWPTSDQIGLLDYLKKNGSRLGGNTGQYFLRFIGKDSFILSKDVVMCLQNAGLDIKQKPSSKKELKLAQDAFNQWHEQTKLPYTHLSAICAFSIGTNYDNEFIKIESKKFEHR